MTHEYNRSDLRPMEFLFEVMHDKSVPMEQRIVAADKLLQLVPEQSPFEPSLVPIGNEDCTVTLRVGGLREP